MHGARLGEWGQRGGTLTITRENTINYLFDQGMFIQEIFTDKLSIDQQILVSNTVGKLVMQVVEGITNIQVERDKSNLPAED